MNTFRSNSFFRYYFVLKYKTNEIRNKFLLAEDEFMPEMHLKQPGYTYSDSRPFNKKRMSKKIKEARNSRYMYQNELDKTCFQHDIT